MLCSCGFKNPEKARFCQECGQKLIENITFEETNPGGIKPVNRRYYHYINAYNIFTYFRKYAG